MGRLRKEPDSRYGRWLVLGEAPSRCYKKENGGFMRKRFLFCECECGVRREIGFSYLTSKASTQCKPCGQKSGGIKNRKYGLKEQYGRWTVLFNYIMKKNLVFCECRCKCGNTRFIWCSNLKKGQSTQCGPCGKKNKRRYRCF